MKYIVGFLIGILATISLAVGAQSEMLLLREIDQNLTTLLREFRLMREACFMP